MGLLNRNQLHEYQKYSIQFIKDHPAAAIFLDCGMGKTSITLIAIEDMLHDSFEVRKILIVAPIRVAVSSWPAEICKWEHLRHLSYTVAVGTQSQRIAALKTDVDIHIINQENIHWPVEQSGLPFQYDMIVIDELSSFKSWQSKRFKALMKVRPMVNRVVGLTGTPSSNGLMDLFAEFRLLDMGKRLGRFITRYRDEFFLPDKRALSGYSPISPSLALRRRYTGG